MIIDIHAHNGTWTRSPGLPGITAAYDYLGETMPEFIADLDRDAVSHCLISSTTALVGDPIEGNIETYRASDMDSRLFAYTYYHPMQIDVSLAEIEKYRFHPKFIGFKTRPEHHEITLDHPSYEPLLQAAAAMQRPILVHCMLMEDAHGMAATARRFHAPLIMVHAGGARYEEAVGLVRDLEHVFIEPVTSMHHPGKIRKILDIVGHERLMFGSDYGAMSRPRIMRTYEEAKLSDTEEEAIFRNNALQLFRLPAAG